LQAQEEVSFKASFPIFLFLKNEDCFTIAISFSCEIALFLIFLVKKLAKPQAIEGAASPPYY
jgi:hypothetical protein